MRTLTLLLISIALTINTCNTWAYSYDLQRNFNFATSSDHWLGDFADYVPEQEAFFELAWGWENLPAERNQDAFSKGLFLSGNNHSDDLFMFIKTPITDLKANTTYAVTIVVDIASDIPPDMLGAGGAEGESVYFKVGATTKEPGKIMQDGKYVLDIDKGNQHTSGKNAIVVGNLANPLVNPEHRRFALKKMGNFTTPIYVTTNSQGQCWIIVGTDSGYEGLTKYYIGKINVTLREKYPL